VRVHVAAHTHKIIMAIALAAWLPSLAFAMTPSQVYEQVKDSVVVVKAYDRQGKQVGLASGVMLPSGDIITNAHVVKAGVRYTVGRGKQVVPATLKAGDPDKDLCLLTAPMLVAEPARLGKAARLKVGEPVYAVGAPQGLELSLSEGIVSQLRGGDPPIIQTTVAISPGSSGGGLFNAKGELVGITTFYLKDGQSLNFALPVEWIAEVAGRKIQERPIGKAPTASEPDTKPKGGWEDWDSRAFAYINQGRYGEAIEAYREALRLKPDPAKIWWIWCNIGVAYSKMERYSESIVASREALRLKPDEAWVWVNLGNAYAGQGRYGEAIDADREALRLKPDLPAAWNALGAAYAHLGGHREAIEAYRKSLRLEPDNADTWYNLGVAYANLGNRSAALEALKELRRDDPKEADRLFNLIMKP
jgi:Flp pilus assembly protein TadD